MPLSLLPCCGTMLCVARAAGATMMNQHLLNSMAHAASSAMGERESRLPDALSTFLPVGPNPTLEQQG